MSALRVHILLLACVVLGSGEVEKAKDGRVVLNLGFLTSKTGGFVSAGTYCGILGERPSVCPSRTAHSRCSRLCTVTIVLTGRRRNSGGHLPGSEHC